MTNRWLEMRLKLPDRAVDLTVQTLMDLGCTGVTSAEKALDTFVVPPSESLANDPVLRAYFAYPDDMNTFCQTVRQALAELAGIYPELADPNPEYQELADQDWASDWQQHFPPFRVGRHLVICPSWVEWPATAEEVILTLDPGQAFGTGTHATTGLCLEALADHFASACPPQRVLDVGTGSGILAMACAALGADEVVACDIDKDACRVASDNVDQNHLAGQVTITDKPLAEIPGRYDLVLANILAAENIRLAELLVERIAHQGRLVLTGILIEQEQQVIDAFTAFPLKLLSTDHRDEWTCIVCQRHE
jgi:ribosomal protein L11 methyltransferase